MKGLVSRSADRFEFMSSATRPHLGLGDSTERTPNHFEVHANRLRRIPRCRGLSPTDLRSIRMIVIRPAGAIAAVIRESRYGDIVAGVKLPLKAN
jgi:hypothetical protein